MKISGLIIGMLLVSGVIISLYSFMNGLASEQHYNIKINDSYKDTYDKVTELENNTLDLQRKIQGVAEREDTNFFTGTWDALTITRDIIFGATDTTFTGLTIITGSIGNFFSDIGLGATGAHIMAIVSSILVLLVIGALIFLITKRRW